jgi:hypothetical protein
MNYEPLSLNPELLAKTEVEINTLLQRGFQPQQQQTLPKEIVLFSF